MQTQAERDRLTALLGEVEAKMERFAPLAQTSMNGSYCGLSEQRAHLRRVLGIPA